MLDRLGETIRTYRNRLGFTQNDLASTLLVSPRPFRAAAASGSVWMGTLGHPLHGATACLGEPLNLASWAHTWLKGHPEGRVAGTGAAVKAAGKHLLKGVSETVTSWGSPHPCELFVVLGLTS